MFASGFSWMYLVNRGLGALFGVDIHELEATLGLNPGTAELFAHTMFACLLLILFGVMVRLELERRNRRKGLERYFVSEKLTPLNAMEVYSQGTMNIMGDMMQAKDIKTFFPFIAVLFLYIFTCNVMSIVPGFIPPTDNINTNVGMAVMVFLLFNIIGLTRDPVGYVKHLMGPMLWAAPLLFAVEVISLLFRPLTLSLRLTGNMFGDHTVFTVMSELVAPVLPAAFLALALFVSFMQAFIFALLTTMYIAMAVPQHDHEAH